jgi:UDP-2,3-diacylglucosamine hydrolase
MSVSPLALFISDLHLTPERPLPVQLFYRFIAEVAPGAQSLYILGDFFEAWVGDDDLAQPLHRDVAGALKSLSEHGTAVFFIPGNRDFLIGSVFEKASGLTLLADPSEIDLFNVTTLITHGDLFCTDDASYQAFRQQVRDPAWQQSFLAQPLAQRHALATALRERSEHAKTDKKPEIMDVNSASIRAMLAARPRNARPIQRIIHGHTHRPGCHQHLFNEQICERWVLPDWYEIGGYLACDGRDCRLVAVS